MTAFRIKKDDAALRRAFRSLNLSVKRTEDWAALARELAVRCFPEPKRLGRPEEWTAAKLHRLYCDYSEIIFNHEDYSLSTACRNLKRAEAYKKTWGDYPESVLRKRVRQADEIVGKTRLGGLNEADADAFLKTKRGEVVVNRAKSKLRKRQSSSRTR